MYEFKTIIEPFKIKVVEPIRMTTYEERVRKIEEAGYNVFMLKSEDIIIDLLTDSGTAAMSDRQWGAIMQGDEAYAGSRSFHRFERTVQEIFGFEHVIPTHQGRAAERILFQILVEPHHWVPNNTHFDTTRANIEARGARAVDILCEEGLHLEAEGDFKGNMDVDSLRAFIEDKGRENIPFVMMTVTNNSGGGQPVSMENIREVRRVCDEYGLPLYFDAARFAENAWFIKQREPGYQHRSVREIVREMFSYADGVLVSAKKDAIVNIGGFIALRDADLAREVKNLLILTEGFPTYGGLAGRDLEAMAQGLVEVLDEDYLNYRHASARYLGDHLTRAGIPIVRPPGMHAIYIDAKKFLPHIPVDQFPGQSLTVELYKAGGIRAVEIGSVMFGKTDPESGEFIPAKFELVRLALPRRVYTQSHIDYVIEVVEAVWKNRDSLPGYRIVYEPPMLRHFTAKFEPVRRT